VPEVRRPVPERSGARLLLDLANVYVNSRNFGFDPCAYLDRVPLERLAYVHVAGGHVEHGIHHDTHARRVWPEVLALTTELVARIPDAPVMLERDDGFGRDVDLQGELDAIVEAASAATVCAPVFLDHREVVTARVRTAGAIASVASAGARADDRVATGVGPVAPCPQPDAGGHHQALADAQRTLVDAMLVGAAVPPGFDALRVSIAQRALLTKRRREAASLWPETTSALGAEHQVLFDGYAMVHAAPATGGPWADGAAFVRSLDRRRFHAPAVRAEVRRAWSSGKQPRFGRARGAGGSR